MCVCACVDTHQNKTQYSINNPRRFILPFVPAYTMITSKFTKGTCCKSNLYFHIVSRFKVASTMDIMTPWELYIQLQLECWESTMYELCQSLGDAGAVEDHLPGQKCHCQCQLGSVAPPELDLVSLHHNNTPWPNLCPAAIVFLVTRVH